MIALTLDILLSYYGINSLFIFSYLFIIKKDYYFYIFIIGSLMELLYSNHYLIFMLVSSIIIKNIFKIINENIHYKVILLYVVTLFYNTILMIETNKYNYNYAILMSTLPCIFYITYLFIKKKTRHKLKYENNKQIINSSYIYPMYTYRVKKK